jgi:hypothetical protein
MLVLCAQQKIKATAAALRKFLIVGLLRKKVGLATKTKTTYVGEPLWLSGKVVKMRK